MTIDKETIAENIKARSDVKRKLNSYYYEKIMSGEKGYLLSVTNDYDSNEFITDALNFLTEKEYIVEENKLEWVTNGLYAEIDVQYITGILKRFLSTLDKETINELKEIKEGMLIFDEWDDVMGYFETKKKKYLYAWMTTA